MGMTNEDNESLPRDSFEAWLRSEVAASYDELRADPTQAISSESMRAHLARLRRWDQSSTGMSSRASTPPPREST